MIRTASAPGNVAREAAVRAEDPAGGHDGQQQ